MFNLLHNYIPDRILVTLGPLHVYWYGVFIVLAIIGAIYFLVKMAGLYSLSKDMAIDLAFWLIIGGIIGARLYHVLLEWSYYSEHFGDIFKLWQGGLAIHGGIIGGLIVIWLYSRRHRIDIWLAVALIVPSLALGQAIGRWGNYFNQELFGRPTSLPWGIPIDPLNRVADFYNASYFHPTFLYESLGNFFIFAILFWLHKRNVKNKTNNFKFIAVVYFFLYSSLRFALEFIRIDTTPTWFDLRLPQIVSLIIMLLALIFFLNYYKIITRLALLFRKKGDNMS